MAYLDDLNYKINKLIAKNVWCGLSPQSLQDKMFSSACKKERQLILKSYFDESITEFYRINNLLKAIKNKLKDLKSMHSKF